MSKRTTIIIQLTVLALTLIGFVMFTNREFDPKKQILRTGVAIAPNTKFLHVEIGDCSEDIECTVTVRPMKKSDCADKYCLDIGTDSAHHPITIKETRNF